MILNPDFLKSCGLTPIIDNEVWQCWYIDDTISITFWKISGPIQISYIRNAAIVLFNDDSYTVDELISLCIGLRINLAVPHKLLKSSPGFYGC